MEPKKEHKSALHPDERDSGLEYVGPVPWGTHICQFYDNERDLLDVLVPYFTAGLLNNELCVWIASDRINADRLLEGIRERVPDLDDRVAKMQMRTLLYTEVYSKTSTIDASAILADWVKTLETALSAGYAGLRAAGDTFWLKRRQWKDFAEYEALVHSSIDGQKMIAICTYALDKCSAADIADVISSHKFVLIKRTNAWEVIESSERKKTEEALHSSETKYRSLFHNMVDGFAFHEIVLDENDRPVDYVFIEANEAFEELTGLKKEQIIGKRVTEVFPDIKTDPADWIGRYGKVALTGEGARFESYFTGLGRWYSVRAYSPEKRYFAAIFEDITERKDTEQALLQSQADLNQAQTVAQTGSWRLDVRKNELLWSDETYRIFGIPLGTPLTYEMFLSAIHPEDMKCVDAAWQAALKGEPYDIEHRIVANGTVKWIRERANLEFDERGGLLGGFGTAQDITERKKTEENQSQFLAILGHELRNPLAPMVLSLDLLARKNISDPDLKEALEIIQHQTTNISELLKDLLDISRISQGKIDLQKTTIELRSLIKKTASSIEGVLNKNRQRLAITLPENDLSFEGDPLRIEQILLNLLNNASKYSSEGSTIRLSAITRKNELFIFVIDEGIGLRPERMEEIFQLFMRTEEAKTRKTGGLGVGLYLSRELARLHGGDVYVASEGPDKGSTFTLRLPLGNRGGTAEKEPPPAEVRNEAAKKKVLIVDDNRTLADTVAKAIRWLGCEERTCYSGASALETVKKFRPDIVLMDIGMPDMDGLEAVRRMREDENARNMVFIAVTGYGQKSDKESAQAAGFDHYLVKPIGVADLKRILTDNEA